MIVTTTVAASPVEAGAFGVIAIVTLVVILAVKLLAVVGDGPRSALINRHINVGIAPLLGIFAIIAVMEILGVIT
ncbi:MAG: hypothetical protein HQ553_05750 [Chloroflexi bacterium]|nr:hypothetical protein [Chloroflexota bacterium]